MLTIMKHFQNGRVLGHPAKGVLEAPLLGYLKDTLENKIQHPALQRPKR